MRGGRKTFRERANSRLIPNFTTLINLLETYAESSNSTHISIESDKQPVSVDVDETSTLQEHRHTRKQPPKTFKQQVQISKFFTPVQKQVPASSDQLPSFYQIILVKNQEAPASGLTGEESRCQTQKEISSQARKL